MRALRDPIGVHNFYLTLIDGSSMAATALSAAKNLTVGGFSECSGLEASLEVFEYREGGVNDFVHKFPTRGSFANLTLRHGVIPLQDDLWKWIDGVIHGKLKRRDGLVVMVKDNWIPVKTWTFKRGLPMKWTGPSLNASQNAVALETLEISHEGLSMIGAVPF